MHERIRALAEQALREDLFPPYTPVSCEGYDANDPMDIARYIRTYLLAQHSLVRKDEMLAGTFRYTGVIPCDHTEHENGVDSEMVIPTDCYHKIGHTHIAKFFRPHSDYNPDASPICFLDWDHYCTNYPFIINQGMQGYVKRIERAKIVHQHDDKKLRYLDALAYTVESIRLYLMQTANEYRMGDRPDLADLLDRVPWNAPQNFKEAFQAYWIAWLFLPDSLGRIDQILFPFYDRDIKNGLLTEETAREMVAEFLIKVFSARPGGGFTDHRSADNTFSLGGYAADGHDGFNKLSEIFAETLAELPIWRPQTGVRITRETDIDRMVYLAKLNRKQSNIVFTSDEQRIPAFEKIGIAYEDAANYTMVGCNEWTIMGRGHTGSQGFFNPLKALERVLQQNDQFLTSLDTHVYNYPLSKAYRDGIFGSISFIPIDEAPEKDRLIAIEAERVFLNDRADGYEHYLMVRTDTKEKAKGLEKLYKEITSLRLKRIDSSMTYGTIQRTIKALREKNLAGIICVDMLGEGFDFPNLKIAAVHEPQKSLASTLQFIGRFARTNAEKIGTAKFIAMNDEALRIENRRLYTSDAVWQDMIIELSEKKINSDLENSEAIKHFSRPENGQSTISLHNIRLILKPN